LTDRFSTQVTHSRTQISSPVKIKLVVRTT